MASRRSNRRRGGGDPLTIIYWRDIPAQVTATAGGQSAKVLLDPRFQYAIDRAAIVAGLTETEAYVAQWRREAKSADTRPEPNRGPDPDPDPDAVVARVAAELSDAYPGPRLEALVANGGADTETRAPTETRP